MLHKVLFSMPVTITATSTPAKRFPAARRKWKMRKMFFDLMCVVWCWFLAPRSTQRRSIAVPINSQFDSESIAWKRWAFPSFWALGLNYRYLAIIAWIMATGMRIEQNGAEQKRMWPMATNILRCTHPQSTGIIHSPDRLCATAFEPKKDKSNPKTTIAIHKLMLSRI